jgi:hypothetical protein
LCEQVGIGAQRDARLVERTAQLLRGRERQHLTVDHQGLALGKRARDPVDVVHCRAGGDLLQRDAAADELVFGLHPVAAVGEQRRAIERDHQRAHRSGEARQPLSALPARRQVLRQVRVGRRHEQRMRAVLCERFTHAFDAFALGADPSVHRRSVRSADSRWRAVHRPCACQ